jgi:hypothetical protein
MMQDNSIIYVNPIFGHFPEVAVEDLVQASTFRTESFPYVVLMSGVWTFLAPSRVADISGLLTASRQPVSSTACDRVMIEGD